MHNLNMPAGAPVRLTATARPQLELHRWDIRVLAADGGAARLVYGSRIGGRDIDQRVHIPAQDVNCRLEIRSRHATIDGWADDHPSVEDDTPSELQIGFCDLARPGARHDDVLLSFAFTAADPGQAELEATTVTSPRLVSEASAPAGTKT